MIKIIKNFLPTDYVTDLTNVLESQGGNNTSFPWYFNSRTGAPIKDVTFKDTSQLVHVFWTNPKTFQNHQISQFWELVRPILYFVRDKCDIDYRTIIRVKANLLIPQPNFTKDDFNLPHVDHAGTENYLNIIYFVNESDGDTFIFDGTPPSLTIKQRITPEANSVLIFDGDVYHASSNPIKSDKRIVINTTVGM